MTAARPDWTGRTLALRIGGPAHGGEFVARHEGRVVFCLGGLPGELVDAVVVDDPGRGFCRAEVVRVLESSPDRVAPACPAAAAGAGCCDWSHIAPEAARGYLSTVLAEQFRRIGGIDLAEPPAVDAPDGDDAVTGWRTTARWTTDAAGVPGTRRRRSAALVTEPCAQPDPRLLEAVREAAPGPGVEVLAVLDDDGGVHLASRPDAPAGGGDRADRRARRSRASSARARSARSRPWTPLGEPSPVLRRAGGRTWELPVDAFWQSHRSAAGLYTRLVREELDRRPAARVWDLYGGAGPFTAAALESAPGAEVTLVENSRAGTTAAEATFAGENVQVVRSPVESFLRARAEHDPAGPDTLIVLDPPRGGAGAGVAGALADSGAGRVVHVGCDPASTARDVGVLVKAGWHLRSVRGVAAFPGTHHVEAVAVLDAPSSGGHGGPAHVD